MPAQPRLRSMIVALLGALVLALGSGLLGAPNALADNGYPFDGQDSPGTQHAPKGDDQADKAEKLGGNVLNEVIDLATGIVKCGLNIATDSVPCSF
ncbi:hypothetical protein [Nocardia callitridis]|uniref:DUF732 domain-containing protein n=1 Tax=Nocardia callitridis TaxID=648753 RepID=A0ABP9JU13_9NOCA